MRKHGGLCIKKRLEGLGGGIGGFLQKANDFKRHLGFIVKIPRKHRGSLVQTGHGACLDTRGHGEGSSVFQ